MKQAQKTKAVTRSSKIATNKAVHSQKSRRLIAHIPKHNPSRSKKSSSSYNTQSSSESRDSPHSFPSHPLRYHSKSSSSTLISNHHIKVSKRFNMTKSEAASAPNLVHVTALRKAMQEKGIDAYIIPSADAHISEYVAAEDGRRAFISEFTGSAGTAVVTADKALLWTDGRYFLQASEQLPQHWTLMKQGVQDVPTMLEWLCDELAPNTTIGFDSRLVSVDQYNQYASVLQNAKKRLLVSADNLIDPIWGNERPVAKIAPIRHQELQYTGKTMQQKLLELRTKMLKDGAFAMVFCALDEIAYLFNLRGSDIDFNPVFMSYAVVTLHAKDTLNKDDEIVPEAHIFLRNEAFGQQFEQDAAPYVHYHRYDDIFNYLAQDLAPQIETRRVAQNDVYKIWIDTSKSNSAMYQALGYGMGQDEQYLQREKLFIHKANPITLMKAIKTPEEIEGMKQSHIRDGASMVKFLSWFERQYSSLPDSTTAKIDENTGKIISPWNEYTLAEELERVRAQDDTFLQLSFDTISSVGPNGAIVHYKPEIDTAASVTSGNVYLLDSGAQYINGTTDITRTFYIPSASKPTPTPFQREAFTRVLQGHIMLASVQFPPNTMGPSLDVLARHALWSVGLNYSHGTGHGVGSCLNVHEGPMAISPASRGGSILTTPLVPGMVLSNEPGYYHDGEFGIRIENLVHIVDKKAPQNALPGSFATPFYGFENLTMVPLDRALINIDVLTTQEKQWVNEYHQEVRQLVAPLVKDNKIAAEWLQRNTEPL